MAAIAVDHVFPEWNSLEEDTVTNILGMFNFDAMRNSHPVSYDMRFTHHPIT